MVSGFLPLSPISMMDLIHTDTWKPEPDHADSVQMAHLRHSLLREKQIYRGSVYSRGGSGTIEIENLEKPCTLEWVVWRCGFQIVTSWSHRFLLPIEMYCWKKSRARIPLAQDWTWYNIRSQKQIYCDFSAIAGPECWRKTYSQHRIPFPRANSPHPPKSLHFPRPVPQTGLWGMSSCPDVQGPSKSQS